MALANKIDTAAAQAKLQHWLSGRLDDARGICVSNLRVPEESGISTETVMFDAAWTEHGVERQQSLVARVAPDGEGIFPRYDLAKEFQVLRALAECSPVRAPAALFHEDDSDILGAPFIVMERIAGRVPADDPPFTTTGWVLELSDPQRAKMSHSGLEQLAAIHEVDWRRLGLSFLQEKDRAPGLEAQLGYWRTTARWASNGESIPMLEATFDWLEANKPARHGPDVLNWGDARYGNMVFGNDLTVTGVLDWEMVGLGPREIDLGWWLFLQRHHTEGIGAALPKGLLSAADTVACYEQLSGHKVEHIDYYEIFAGVRVATLTARVAHLMIAAGQVPADSTMALNNPASQLLAKRLGLAPPEGESTSFMGNRQTS